MSRQWQVHSHPSPSSPLHIACRHPWLLAIIVHIRKSQCLRSLFSRDVNKDLTSKDQDKDLTPKDQDKDKDLTPKDQDKDLLNLNPKDTDKDKDLTPKDQDKDKDL